MCHTGRAKSQKLEIPEMTAESKTEFFYGWGRSEFWSGERVPKFALEIVWG